MPQLSFQKKTDWDQAVENVGLATADSAVTLSAGATSLQTADDFNAATRDPLWLTHVAGSVKPTQAGGFLTFQYDATSGSPDHVHVTRNVAQGGMEFEARFRRRLLAPNFNTGMFSIAILQGVREIVDDPAREAKVIHEFRMTITNNGIMNWEARIKNQAGQDVFAGSASWPVVVNQGMIAPDGQIFTLRATKSGSGIVYLLYHSDNPSNVLFQTQVSPTPRTLSGDIFFEIGGPVPTNGAFGCAIDFDYVKLDTPPVFGTTGFLRLQHAFGIATTLNSFDFGRLLPTQGDTVKVQFRSGHTLAELQTAAFGSQVTTSPGSFDPSNPPAQWEKAVLSLPAAEFWETKITITRVGSTSPTLQAYNLTFTPITSTSPPPTQANPLTLKRVITSIENWNGYVEKSPSVAIVTNPAGGGMAILAAVYQDLFDGFSIDSEWAVYQRSATVFESFGFLRMAMLSTDCDAMVVKKTPLPTSYTMTVQWMIQGSESLPANTLFATNILTLFNGPTLPVPNDLRFGGVAPGSHDTVIIRWLKKPDGSRRFSFIALRSDNQFVSWNGSAWVTGGAVDFVMTAGKEATEWSFDVTVTNGSLTIKAKDDQGTVRFDTSAQPLQIKNADASCWLVLGDSNVEMPNQATYLYDAVLTNIPTSGPTNGYIRFRNSLGARGRLGKITLIPSTQIQTVLGKVLLKARSANTLTDLLAAPFVLTAQFVPDILGSIVDLGLAPGSFIEVELDLFSASPGPEIVLFTWEMEPLIDDNPMIYLLNLIDSNATAVSASANTGITEDQSTVPNIKDGDPSTQWISSAYQEGYSIQWTLNIGIVKNGVPYQDIIDTIILRNTNFNRIDILLAQIGFTNPKVVFSGQLYTSDAVISFDPYLASTIIITITSSQTPNDKKKLGEIYAGRFLAALPGFDKYEPKRDLLESGSLRTLGGKLIAYRGKDKYGSHWEISQVAQADKDNLEAVFKANPLITFYPEPKTRPRDLFNVGWNMEALPFPYSDVVKGAGYSVEGEMTEV